MMSPEHVAHPYPTEQEKAQIMAETGIELKQLTNWFVNNRKRYWKPRVEAKLQKFQPHPQVATLPGGSLSIAVHHHHMQQPNINPKAQRQGSSTSFPTLPAVNNQLQRFLQHAAAGGPPSPHAHPMAHGGPAGPGAQLVLGAYREMNDPHTISDGSGSSSSAYNSDEDSVDASSSTTDVNDGRALSSQHLDSRFASVSSTNSTGPMTKSSSIKSVARTSSGYRRHEEVDVHVLRPEGTSDMNGDESLPTLRDLTIKSSVPKDRVLATFKCPISYTIPYEIEHDRKRVQSRRDGEVLRVKKHYLKLYLATRGIHSVSSPLGTDSSPPPSRSGSVSSMDSEVKAAAQKASSSPLTPVPVTASSSSTVTPAPSSRSCSFTCTDLDDQGNNSSSSSPEEEGPRRKRARTASGSFLKGEEEWRELCQNAPSLRCESLPGLEEAAQMFGVTP